MHLSVKPEADDDQHEKTRRQLLAAAGEVFAEVGFRQATVREICQRAGANVAAVNYHFGDKEGLYAEVLREAQRQAFARYPLLAGAGPHSPPADKLRAFIRSFLLRALDSAPTAWFGKMMLREMIEPTGALDSLLKERMRPMADQLRGVVAELLGCSREDYHHCRRVVARLFPEQPLDVGAVEPLADHIARFSLAAMKHLTEPETARRRSRALSRTRR